MAKKKDMNKQSSKNQSFDCSDDCKCGCKMRSTGACFIYGLGFIGSAIYFIGHATTFWGGVLGFLKAIVWPVFLTLKIFGI